MKSHSEQGQLPVCHPLHFNRAIALNYDDALHKGVDRLWRARCLCGWTIKPTRRLPTARKRLAAHLALGALARGWASAQ